MSAAWALWDKTWADCRISFLAEPEYLESEFRSRARLSSASESLGGCIPAGVCGDRWAKLVTFDRALKSRGVDVVVL